MIIIANSPRTGGDTPAPEPQETYQNPVFTSLITGGDVIVSQDGQTIEDERVLFSTSGSVTLLYYIKQNPTEEGKYRQVKNFAESTEIKVKNLAYMFDLGTVSFPTEIIVKSNNAEGGSLAYNSTLLEFTNDGYFTEISAQ